MHTVAPSHLHASLSDSVVQTEGERTDLAACVDHFYDQTKEQIQNNMGRAIAYLQIGVEKRKDEEIRKILDSNQELKAQSKTLMECLQYLEAELANPQAKVINLANHSEIVAQVHQLIPHPLLEKTEWSREEAQSLCRILPHRSEQVLHEMSDKMQQVQDLVTDRHELLNIFREMMKMWREMHEIFMRNQRVS